MPPPAKTIKSTGIFGGTFDPVHLGHLCLANAALAALRLDQIIWIPVGNPPHRGLPTTAPQHRLRMVELAIADNPAFSVDAGEVASAAPSYTVLTLERLRLGLTQQGADDTALVCLLGADAFAGLESWYRWTDIFALAHIAIAQRPGYPFLIERLSPGLQAQYRQRLLPQPQALAAAPAGAIVHFSMPPMPVAATRIRQQLALHQDVAAILPPRVAQYITQHGIYSGVAV